MTKIGNISKLRELKHNLKVNAQESTIRDLFQFVRIDYLTKNLSYHVRNVLEKCEIQIPSNEHMPSSKCIKFSEIQNNHRLNWGDIEFHLNYRVTDLSDLSEFIPDIKPKLNELNRIIEKGYILSVLPLNLVLPPEVIRQFIPPFDFTDPHPAKDKDPYGIYLKGVRILSDKAGLPLGSHKFPHSVLMDIHGWCPIGCSDCYKSYYTREKGHDLGVSRKTIKKQTESLVKWLNYNPEVYDVIISGGEPLTISNLELKAMLDIFKKAKFLKVLRICTGALFLGLPFRIDEELLNIITEFCENTGVRLTFNAHLSNHYQITPEAMLAIQKIRKCGFKIYSQVPIKEGVNFFSDDLKKTIGFWTKLGQMQLLCDIEPYKFIIDMHPRTLAYYVPIESVLRVWNRVYESHNYPELERPRTLSILCQQGNIILSGHTLFAMEKEIDRENKIVRYYIPAAITGKLNRPLLKTPYFTYHEPLLAGRNDDPCSLEKLKNWFNE